MAALNSERRVYLWNVLPKPNPSAAPVVVTLEEFIGILEAEFTGGRARVFLSEGARVLEDDDKDRDEKNQLYITDIRRSPEHEAITLLINRGDPNATATAYINSETKAVRVVPPGPKESPAWSAHLVISTAQKGGRHRACFEKMPRVSTDLVLAALDEIVTRAILNNPHYTYDVMTTVKGKTKVVRKRYRPELSIGKVASERLIEDLENGELSGVTLTRRTESYNGVGVAGLVKRQEEKIVIHTKPASADVIAAFLKPLNIWAKANNFEAVTFHIDKLPGNVTSNPTLTLDDRDALETLYARAQRISDFGEILEQCYGQICSAIEEKMLALLKSGHGW